MPAKLDFSPLLRQLADKHSLSAADVARLINDVAPGAVSRRAVDYWLADRVNRDSRPCDSKWVSLLAQSLWLNSKVKRSDVEALRALMHEVADGNLHLAACNARPARVSAAALSLLNRAQHMSELKQIRATGGRSKSVDAVRRAKVSVPGL